MVVAKDRGVLEEEWWAQDNLAVAAGPTATVVMEADGAAWAEARVAAAQWGAHMDNLQAGKMVVGATMAAETDVQRAALVRSAEARVGRWIVALA